MFLSVLFQNLISLPILSVCSFVLSPFSIRALGMLIIVVSNSQADYSSIPAVFGSDSVACSGFSNCALPFVCLVSSLLPGRAALCPGAADRPSVLWWQVCGGECSGCVIRSQSSRERVSLACELHRCFSGLLPLRWGSSVELTGVGCHFPSPRLIGRR